MEILGKWKKTAMLSLAEDGTRTWKDVDEYIKEEFGDDPEAATFKDVMLFLEDGTMKLLLLLPEETTQEEIDAAVAAGKAEVIDRMIVREVHKWKCEDEIYAISSMVEDGETGEEKEEWLPLLVSEDKYLDVYGIMRYEKM